MIKLFVDLWDKNKDKLENYFRNTSVSKYGTSYTDLLKTVINQVLNNSDLRVKFSDKVDKIEFGDYIGIMILTFSLKVEFPSTNDIFYTSIDYGSCTACDAIQMAWNEDDFETMIKSYMILSLHLIQHMKCYGNIEASRFISYKEDNVFNTIIDEKKKILKVEELRIIKGRKESKFIEDIDNEDSKILILKKKRFDYICELTEDMDKYIKFENPTSFNTYIYNDKIDKYWLIRFPGATRGRITVDENEVITNIEIYKDENNIYKPETEDILKEKYIGYKIIIE